MSTEDNHTEYGWAWYEECVYNMRYLEYFGLWDYPKIAQANEQEPPKPGHPDCRGHGFLATYADHEALCLQGLMR